MIKQNKMSPKTIIDNIKKIIEMITNNILKTLDSLRLNMTSTEIKASRRMGIPMLIIRVTILIIIL